jgi:hypothetical protein
MQKIAVSVLVIAGLLLSGCAGTASKVQSEYRLAPGEKLRLQLTTPPNASPEGIAILNSRLTTQLASNGLLGAASDPAARIVDVTVTNYYMRHGATRALVGIMAGSDNIQSTVKIKDQTNGNVLSEFAVESKNPTAWGTSQGLIEDHADQIVETLKAGKR